MSTKFFQGLTTITTHWRQLGVLVYCLITCISSALAQDLKFVDQQGEPIKGLVVSVPMTESSSVQHDIAVMDQIDKQFVPHVLVVNKGQEVRFPNSDNIRHHIYSFSKVKPFEFRMFKGGESKSIQFDQSGVAVLGCNIHDQMVGYIYIAENEITAITNEDGQVSINTQATQAKVWHERLSANHIERQDITLSPAVQSTQSFTINLLPKKQTQTKRKFGSRKFSKGED